MEQPVIEQDMSSPAEFMSSTAESVSVGCSFIVTTVCIHLWATRPGYSPIVAALGLGFSVFLVLAAVAEWSRVKRWTLPFKLMGVAAGRTCLLVTLAGCLYVPTFLLWNAITIRHLEKNRDVQSLNRILEQQDCRGGFVARTWRLGAAIDALGRLRDKRAIGALSSIANDPAFCSELEENDLSINARKSLRRLGATGVNIAIDSLLMHWHASNTDVTRETIEREMAEVTEAGAAERYRSIMQKRDLSSIAAIHVALINQGQADTVPVLIEALESHGHKQMALDYIGSGNPALEEAGRSWAEDNGYEVVVGLPYGGGRGAWGSN